MNDTLETATLAGGCFWCLDAVFRQLRGVERVSSGYTGGHTADPTYHDVCSGATGHAEVVRVEFDPAEVDFRGILEVFFATHDPTTLNRQGGDSGTQYRSAIFVHDEIQRSVAEELMRELAQTDPAESYHDDYYRQNPKQGYCQVVISPKLSEFRQRFADRLLDP